MYLGCSLKGSCMKNSIGREFYCFVTYGSFLNCNGDLHKMKQRRPLVCTRHCFPCLHTGRFYCSTYFFMLCYHVLRYRGNTVETNGTQITAQMVLTHRYRSLFETTHPRLRLQNSLSKLITTFQHTYF